MKVIPRHVPSLDNSVGFRGKSQPHCCDMFQKQGFMQLNGIFKTFNKILSLARRVLESCMKIEGHPQCCIKVFLSLYENCYT